MWIDISRDQKLAQLRSRTDRSLASLLKKLLERGFQELNRGRIAQADALCTQTARLLPLVYSLPAPDFLELWSEHRELRTELDDRREWKRLAS